MKALRVLVIIMMTSCENGDARAPLSKFGLAEAPGARPELLEAISTANEILGKPALAGGWTGHDASSVLVFAVAGDGLGPFEVMGTYERCHCILVQAAVLEKWLDKNTGTATAKLEIDNPRLLAYMLLHEVGHLSAKHRSAHLGEAGGAAPAELNLIDTSDKAEERAADEFAATSIAAASRAAGMRGIDAMMTSMELTNLSWNLQVHRSLDHFGASALKAHSVFWDLGLSHPNLEWRVLVMNDLIQHNEQSHALLNELGAALSCRGSTGAKPIT